MTSTPDPRRLLWSLLAVWVGVELLSSSRWWPPSLRPPRESPVPSSDRTLRSVLAEEPSASVWFAPYSTFPEMGLVESQARGGVYDTFLALPIGSRPGVAANFGAHKLSPTDLLFSQASARGLDAEADLAHRLGYSWLALDLGAVSTPQQVKVLCRRQPDCRLTSDAYALFRLGGSTQPSLASAMAGLNRRVPLLPLRSAGPSWGGLVFHPFHWRIDQLRPAPSPGAEPQLEVRAVAGRTLQIYRYPLEAFPAPLRSGLHLSHDGVRLELAPTARSAVVCIGASDASTCQLLGLGPDQRNVAIGDRIAPGGLTTLRIDAIDPPVSGTGAIRITVQTSR